jgi:tetratricopeptide (TPR) repeat protein
MESSLPFARLMAEGKRYQQASKLLRDALRYNPTNDALVRLLYQICLAQDSLGQASQILKKYREALAKEHFNEQEIQKALQDFPKEKPVQGWLADS